jgi:hypothetical protein
MQYHPVIPTVEYVDSNSLDPEQQPFTRDDAVKAIYDLCSKQDYMKIQVVTPISFGNGKMPDGRGKSTGLDNSQGTLPDNTANNGLWLSASIANRDGCGSSYQFGYGNTAGDKTKYCVARFTSVLDGCQTNTGTTKYGGSLAYGCEYYQIAGRYANVFAESDAGTFQCNPA